jgi:hypothetical protein
MIIDSVGRVDQNPYSLQEMCTALFMSVSVMPSRWFCLLGYNPGFLFNTPYRGCVPAGVKADYVSSVLCGVLRSVPVATLKTNGSTCTDFLENMRFAHWT